MHLIGADLGAKWKLPVPTWPRNSIKSGILIELSCYNAPGNLLLGSSTETSKSLFKTGEIPAYQWKIMYALISCAVYTKPTSPRKRGVQLILNLLCLIHTPGGAEPAHICLQEQNTSL